MTKDQLIDLCKKAAESDYEAREDLLGEGEGLTLESRKVGDQRRWSQLVTIVLKDEEGKYWRFSFDQGLTENQDDEWSGAARSLRQVERRSTEKVITVVTFEPVADEVA